MRAASLVALLVTLIAACRPSGPAGGGVERSAVPSIADVLQRHTDSLMAIPGVVGVGQGGRHGAPTVYVMVVQLNDSVRRALPDSIEGYAVEIVESGEIKAQPE